MTVIVESNTLAADLLRSGLAGAPDVIPSLDAARRHLEESPDEMVVVIGPSVDLHAAGQFAQMLRITRSDLGVVLVRGRVDSAVLAEALRAGMREVVEERDLASLGAAVNRSRDLSAALRARFGADTSQRAVRGRIVTVFAAKGGSGKTTTATNLAVALAEGGKHEVCLVDLDLSFGDVAITLQLFPAHSVADAVPWGRSIDLAAVESLLTPHSPGLVALVAPVQPDAKESIDPELVGQILELLRGRFEYVVIDTPPSFDDFVLAAFDRSDILLLLTTLDVPALKNLKLTLETLDLLNFPRDRWRLVLNRADAKVGLTPAEVEKTLRAPITSSIPSSRDVPASINRGRVLVSDDPGHPVSLAFKHLARQVRGETSLAPDDTEASAIRRGTMRRWRAK